MHQMRGDKHLVLVPYASSSHSSHGRGPGGGDVYWLWVRSSEQAMLVSFRIVSLCLAVLTVANRRRTVVHVLPGTLCILQVNLTLLFVVYRVGCARSCTFACHNPLVWIVCARRHLTCFSSRGLVIFLAFVGVCSYSFPLVALLAVEARQVVS